MTERDDDGGLDALASEMDRYLAHERRRLRVIALVLALIGVLLAAGHALDDADGSSLLPLALDDLIAGLPSLFALGVSARLVWVRARELSPSSARRRSRTAGHRTGA